MNKMMSALLALAISLPAFAEVVTTNEIGGLESLRKEEVSIEPQAEYMKQDKEGPAMGRDFVDMPPLVPHSVDRYQVDKNANSCLRCHSMKNADKWGATKIAVSHYNNRDGEQLADVAPNRYFCLTCHVPQKDAKPLKENTFEPVESLKKH